jgi:hypothetical protein
MAAPLPDVSRHQLCIQVPGALGAHPIKSPPERHTKQMDKLSGYTRAAIRRFPFLSLSLFLVLVLSLSLSPLSLSPSTTLAVAAAGRCQKRVDEHMQYVDPRSIHYSSKYQLFILPRACYITLEVS